MKTRITKIVRGKVYMIAAKVKGSDFWRNPNQPAEHQRKPMFAF